MNTGAPNRPLAIGITGRDAIDGLFPHATYEIEGERVLIHSPNETHVIETDGVAKAGAKLPGVVKPELWASVGDLRVGGGGPNTCIAAKLAAADIPLRYLDACAHDHRVKARLAYPGLEIWNLSLEDVSTNLLLGASHNRIVIKQSKTGARVFASDDHLAGLQWLTRCKCVRANSVKHIEVAEYLVEQAVSGNVELHIVPTPYLPPDFVASRWLSAASEVCTSQDEIGKVMGWDVDQSLTDAPAVIRRLRQLTPKAIILLTRGDDGVVVSLPDHMEPVHVRLERGWDNVQQYIANDPTVLCGAGDACATGSTLLLRGGRSVLGYMGDEYPMGVKAGIAGSALALRWIGWMPQMLDSDFTVRRMAVPVRVAAA